MSNVTASLIEKLQARDALGLLKYGKTLDRDDLSLDQWLAHLQEELLDAAGYIESVRQTMREASK